MFSALICSLNYSRWPKETLCACLELLRDCDKLAVRLQSDPNLDNKDKIDSAIQDAVDALEQLDGNSNYDYDKDNEHDLIRKAQKNIKQLLNPDDEHKSIQPPKERLPKGKLATATKMMKEIADTSTTPRYPVEVNICNFSASPFDQVTNKLEYSFTGVCHTVDDLLYFVRLRHPGPEKEHPYIYCRSVKAHRHTREGSKFNKIEPSRSLTGLPFSGEKGAAVIYLIEASRDFILLVRGIPFGREGNGKDTFCIVHEFGEVITKVITQHASALPEIKTVTFYHISEASWTYTWEKEEKSTKTITWKDHKTKKRLKLYEGEWFACISQSPP